MCSMRWRMRASIATGLAQRGRAPRHSRARSCSRKLLHGVTIPALALFGWGAGFGALVFRRRGGGGGDPGLRASAGEAGRSVAPRCGVLHDERRDEPHGVRLCADRPGSGAMTQDLSRRPRHSPAPAARRTASACSRCSPGTSSHRADHLVARLAPARDRVAASWTMPASRPHRRRLVQSITVYPDDDRGARPASGSHRTRGMVICPCSMGTVAAIAAGTSRSLVERAADVTLKERRKLILVPRETPLSLIHLRNLVTVTEAGAVVIPAAPGFLSSPDHDRRAGRLHRAADSRPARPRHPARAALDRLSRAARHHQRHAWTAAARGVRRIRGRRSHSPCRRRRSRWSCSTNSKRSRR